MKAVIRALGFFRADAPRLAGVFLLMFAGTVLGALKPWPLAVLVDSVLGGRPLPSWLEAPLPASCRTGAALLTVLVASIFAVHLAHAGLSALHQFSSIRIGLRGLTRVRNALFERLERLSLRFHRNNSAGDLIYRSSWDVCAFQTIFQQGLVLCVSAAASLALMTAVMWRVNVRLTLAALAVAPLLAAAMRLLGRRMSRRADAAQQADSRVTAFVQRTLAVLPLVQSHALEDREQRRFGEAAAAAETRRLAQHGSELLYGFAVAGVFGLGMAALAWLGAGEVEQGRLTLGELLVFLSYLAQLYEPLNQLSHAGATVAGAKAGAARVFEVLDAGDDIAESPQARPVVRAGTPQPADGGRTLVLRGRIDFEHVSFGYEPDRPVLRGVDFSLEAGASAAVTGPSGAGKTTLLHLLPRLFDPCGGAVRLDGADVRDLRLRDLRRNVAMVFQQPLILPGTIADNIACGLPGVRPEDIRAAAQAARAAAFIEALPLQYDTVVGDGAMLLSIGEQQRINLARAFLKNAPILLLDEPTSALDEENEALVLDSLKQLMRGRTVLLAAHRPQVVRCAGRVLVLENGRLREIPPA